MDIITIIIKGISYKILVAKELADWKDGLRGDKLKYVDGMLMVFPNIRQINITMTGMLYDLDVFWLDNFGKIIKLLKKEPKVSDDNINLKIVGVECQYLLEINSTKNLSDILIVGDKINIEPFF